MDVTETLPWYISVDEKRGSVKIHNKNGGVVCLMKSCNGKKKDNAILILESVNEKEAK